MNRYQLAKLIEWSKDGKLETRKRLQKVIYLLQAAKCPLDAEFTLHHYGPYSHDVAELVDEMVNVELIKENKVKNSTRGYSYHYTLPCKTKSQLQELDQNRKWDWSTNFMPFNELAKDLLGKEVRELELAATIAYFYKLDKDWSKATEQTAKFKNQDLNSASMQQANELAKHILSSPNNQDNK